MASQWVRWHPRGHLVLAGTEDSMVWMWNADKGSYLNSFSGHGSSVTCGDFTPDGNFLHLGASVYLCVCLSPILPLFFW